MAGWSVPRLLPWRYATARPWDREDDHILVQVNLSALAACAVCFWRKGMALLKDWLWSSPLNFYVARLHFLSFSWVSCITLPPFISTLTNLPTVLNSDESLICWTFMKVDVRLPHNWYSTVGNMPLVWHAQDAMDRQLNIWHYSVQSVAANSCPTIPTCFRVKRLNQPMCISNKGMVLIMFWSSVVQASPGLAIRFPAWPKNF